MSRVPLNHGNVPLFVRSRFFFARAQFVTLPRCPDVNANHPLNVITEIRFLAKIPNGTAAELPCYSVIWNAIDFCRLYTSKKISMWALPTVPLFAGKSRFFTRNVPKNILQVGRSVCSTFYPGEIFLENASCYRVIALHTRRSVCVLRNLVLAGKPTEWGNPARAHSAKVVISCSIFSNADHGYWTTSVGVRRRKRCVTRMRFAGTSGPWCLCCGESLGRGRQWRHFTLISIRGCSRWVRLLLSLAEHSSGCINE